MTTTTAQITQENELPEPSMRELMAELTALKGRVSEQEERIITQEAELTQLRISTSATIVSAQGHDKFAHSQQPESETQKRPTAIGKGTKSNRRGLLKMGGAAAAVLAASTVSMAIKPKSAHAATQLYGSTTDLTPAVWGSATNGGRGIFGQSDTGYGVYGYSSSSYGVYGYSDSYYGVYGYSSSQSAVYGYSSSSNGIYGYSDNGAGVRGYSYAGIGGIFTGILAPLKLEPSGNAGAPTTNTHSKGEVYVDSNGTHFICTADGTPGTWGQLATTNQGLQTFPDPRRVFGASVGNNVTSGPIDATTKKGGGASGVPAGARAAYCAVQSSTAGVLTIFPDGAGDPGSANWSGTATGHLNLTYMLVPLSSAGAFRIHAFFNGAIYVDVWGYYM